jgi:hypothetical protein
LRLLVAAETWEATAGRVHLVLAEVAGMLLGLTFDVRDKRLWRTVHCTLAHTTLTAPLPRAMTAGAEAHAVGGTAEVDGACY